MTPSSQIALSVEVGSVHVVVMVILNWATKVASCASIKVWPRAGKERTRRPATALQSVNFAMLRVRDIEFHPQLN